MELLQTIGICVGSIALVAIAVMMFFILINVAQPEPEEYFSVADIMDRIADEPLSRGRPKKK